MSTPSWRSSKISSTSSPDARSPDREALRRRLEAPPLGQIVALLPEGSRIVLVGGAIRDALLGRECRDLDLIVEGDFDRLVARIGRERGRMPADIGDTFQRTRRLRWKGLQIDLAVAQGSIRDDLPRRDFTVNAMGVELSAAGPGELLDPCGGLDDLAARRLRLTSPQALHEDPLRALRGVRYAASLPAFQLADSTASEIARHADRLSQVAPERVAGEWLTLLSGEGWSQALELGWELGVATATLGTRLERTAVAAWDAAERRSGSIEPACRLAALLLEIAPEVATASAALRERRWPRRLVARARRVAKWAADCPVVAEAMLVEWALDAPGDAEIAARLAAALAPASEVPDFLARLAARGREARWVDGGDLIGWGMSPGPALGALLREAARGQLVRRWSDAEEARAWVREQVADHEAPS